MIDDTLESTLVDSSKCPFALLLSKKICNAELVPILHPSLLDYRDSRIK